MAGIADTTVQLTADDLMIADSPSPAAENTIQLSGEDVVLLEGGPGATLEVVVRPLDLQLSPWVRLAELSATVFASLRRVGARCWHALRRILSLTWSVARRTSAAIRGRLAPATGHAFLSALGSIRTSTAKIWVSLHKGSQALWDASFPIWDWVWLKLRPYTRSRGGLRVRAVGPADRTLVEDLQRALSAYCTGADSKLQITEVGGRVAVLVPGREPQAEAVVRPEPTKTEPTVLGRPLITSTR